MGSCNLIHGIWTTNKDVLGSSTRNLILAASLFQLVGGTESLTMGKPLNPTLYPSELPRRVSRSGLTDASVSVCYPEQD
jgi:hypothetical protein